MLMIRLSRVGKKKYPTYRIVVQEKSRDPWGKALEILGNYNPHTKDFTCQADRIKYWLSVGAQMSATLNNLLINKKVIQGKKMKAAVLNKKKKEEKKPAEKKDSVGTGDSPVQDKKEPAPSVPPVDKPVEDKKDEKKDSVGTGDSPVQDKEPDKPKE